MADRRDADRLLTLLDEALAEADRLGDTLLAALIAECVEIARRDAARRSSTT